MNYNIFFNTICLIAVCFGCQSKNNGTTKSDTTTIDTSYVEITVNPASNVAVPFDSIIDRVSFVRLETSNDCLIGTVNQIICTEELIFIMDREVANSIFCFDMEGHFLYKIGKIGQGPGEYTRLCNIALIKDKKQLVAVDWNGKLHYYDLNGKYLKDDNIPFDKFPFNGIEFTQNATIGFYEGGFSDEEAGRPMLSVADKKWNNIYRAFPSFYKKKFKTNASMFPLRKFGNKVYLNRPWTNSFYLIDEDGYREVFRINIIDGGYPPITDDTDSDLYSQLLNKTVHFNDYVFLKDAAVFYFSISGARWSPFVIYSHKTNQLYKCSGTYTNPLFVFQNNGNTPLASSGDRSFITQQSASTVMGAKNMLYNTPGVNNGELEKLYNGLVEDSNPVLFFFHVSI